MISNPDTRKKNQPLHFLYFLDRQWYKPDIRKRSQKIRSLILLAQSWAWCYKDFFNKNKSHRISQMLVI